MSNPTCPYPFFADKKFLTAQYVPSSEPNERFLYIQRQTGNPRCVDIVDIVEKHLWDTDTIYKDNRMQITNQYKERRKHFINERIRKLHLQKYHNSYFVETYTTDIMPINIYEGIQKNGAITRGNHIATFYGFYAESRDNNSKNQSKDKHTCNHTPEEQQFTKDGVCNNIIKLVVFETFENPVTKPYHYRKEAREKYLKHHIECLPREQKQKFITVWNRTLIRQLPPNELISYKTLNDDSVYVGFYAKQIQMGITLKTLTLQLIIEIPDVNWQDSFKVVKGFFSDTISKGRGRMAIHQGYDYFLTQRFAFIRGNDPERYAYVYIGDNHTQEHVMSCIDDYLKNKGPFIEPEDLSDLVIRSTTQRPRPLGQT